MATHSSILAWKIPWTEDPGGYPWGLKESDTTEQLHFHCHFSYYIRGNCEPLPCLFGSSIGSLRKMSFNQVPPSSESHMQRDIDSRATGVAYKKRLHKMKIKCTSTHTHRHWGDFCLSRKTSDKLREGLRNIRDLLLCLIHLENCVKNKIEKNVKYIIENMLSIWYCFTDHFSYQIYI